MQKGKGHSPALECANDACLSLFRPENPYHATAASVYTALLFWKLPQSWDIIYGCWRMPSARHKCHRPKGETTGHLFILSTKINGRPALYSADRPKLPAESGFWQQQRTDSVWHGISSKCKHGHTPHHAMDSRERGPRSSGHQLCIFDAWWPKRPRLQFNVKCMQTKHMNTNTLSC